MAPRYDNYYRQFPECRENIERPPSEIIGELYFDSVTMHGPALKLRVGHVRGPGSLFLDQTIHMFRAVSIAS